MKKLRNTCSFETSSEVIIMMLKRTIKLQIRDGNGTLLLMFTVTLAKRFLFSKHIRTGIFALIYQVFASPLLCSFISMNGKECCFIYKHFLILY